MKPARPVVTGDLRRVFCQVCAQGAVPSSIHLQAAATIPRLMRLGTAELGSGMEIIQNSDGDRGEST
jgi:hypothetical protein